MTSIPTQELDKLTPRQLIDEVKQIVVQYNQEVTTARRTWPKSVRNRVLALARHGVPRAMIGRDCGIPVATVFLWCRRIPGRKKSINCGSKSIEVTPKSHFLALPKPDNSLPNLTVRVELQMLLPGGFEVRGLTSMDQVLALYQGCRS